MHRRIATLIALLLAVTGASLATITVSGSPVQAKDVNCTDFGSQAAAQNYFLNHGGPNSDPDGLDSDRDGVACESNPCPCNDSTNGGGGGDNSTPSAPSKKFHTVNLRVAQVQSTGNDVVVGKVPTYRGKFQLQRKLKGQTYKLFKRTVAKNPSGQVKAGVAGVAGTCFRVIVPATKKYRLTTKDVGCIKK